MLSFGLHKVILNYQSLPGNLLILGIGFSDPVEVEKPNKNLGMQG